MNRPSPAGAAMLLAAPACAIVATLVIPTVSDDATTQLSALVSHRSAMIAGIALQTVSISLLIGGVIWLAYTLKHKAQRLATAGGVLAVAGSLIPLVEYGVSATGPAISGLLPAAQAVALLNGIHSGAISAIEPLSLVGDLGLALLGVAAVKAGAPKWAGVAVAIGAFAEGIGFGSATRGLVVAGFVVLLVGLTVVVRRLLAVGRPQAVAAPVPAPTAL